jgi:hypothetical protein
MRLTGTNKGKLLFIPMERGRSVMWVSDVFGEIHCEEQLLKEILWETCRMDKIRLSLDSKFFFFLANLLSATSRHSCVYV